MGLFLGWLGREQNARAAEVRRLLPGGFMDPFLGGQQEGQVLFRLCSGSRAGDGAGRWCWVPVRVRDDGGGCLCV